MHSFNCKHAGQLSQSIDKYELIFPETFISFFATRSSYFNSSSNNLSILSKTVINEGNCFEKTAKNSFTAPISGLYWFHVTIGIPSGILANVTFIESPQSLNFRRTYALTSGPGMLAKNSLINMTAGNTLTLVTSYPLYSDNNTHLSFGGLLLDSSMDLLVAFAVYVTCSYDEKQSLYQYSL